MLKPDELLEKCACEDCGECEEATVWQVEKFTAIDPLILIEFSMEKFLKYIKAQRGLYVWEDSDGLYVTANRGSMVIFTKKRDIVGPNITT